MIRLVALAYLALPALSVAYAVAISLRDAWLTGDPFLAVAALLFAGLAVLAYAAVFAAWRLFSNRPGRIRP